MSAAHAQGPWLVEYQHERRKHRHRCQCCSKIVNTGERVYMARVASKTTRVLHADGCAERRIELGRPVSQAELLAAHAALYVNKSLSSDQAFAIGRAALAKVQP